MSAARGDGRLVWITGASGLIGRALSARLEEAGFRVQAIRRPAQGADFFALQECEPPWGVIHLAGENIGQGRWTAARKKRFVHSRVAGTTYLCDHLVQLPTPPAVLLSSSASGIYGDRGEEELQESSSHGSGYLAELCRQWEASTASAEAAGMRVVHLRTGVVLDPGGGALQKMLTPFRLGVGGPIGGGRQWMSWLSLRDTIAAIDYLLTAADVHGAVNLVGPNPVRQGDFARALGAALKRPAFAPLPAWVVKLLFGEMGRDLVLAGAKIRPTALLDAGFQFQDPDLAPFLDRMLGPT